MIETEWSKISEDDDVAKQVSKTASGFIKIADILSQDNNAIVHLISVIHNLEILRKGQKIRTR